MNRYKITFADLKDMSESLVKGDVEIFINYINTFKGINVFEKFKNILKIWNGDVAPTLNLNLNDKPTKIQFSYILSQINDIELDYKIKNTESEIIVGVPETFQTVDDFVPVYDIVKNIKIFRVDIDFKNLKAQDKKTIINNLPANVYNWVMGIVLREKASTVTFDNPALEQFKLNFLSNEPYMFLKGLFSNYDDLYFRDVIFHLSKRIDGQILMQSTPAEIEYFIERYSKEMETQSHSMGI